MVYDVELKIGKVLKQIMAQQRHTLATMSKATGIPKSTISEWISNRSPNPTQAVKLANHLGISLHFLLFGRDDSQEPIQKILKEDFFQGTFEISIKRVKLED
jgi:transcriptional regulator with XRE-family HTH domain